MSADEIDSEDDWGDWTARTESQHTVKHLPSSAFMMPGPVDIERVIQDLKLDEHAACQFRQMEPLSAMQALDRLWYCKTPPIPHPPPFPPPRQRGCGTKRGASKTPPIPHPPPFPPPHQRGSGTKRAASISSSSNAAPCTSNTSIAIAAAKRWRKSAPASSISAAEVSGKCSENTFWC